jgi:hypothetical protein
MGKEYQHRGGDAPKNKSKTELLVIFRFKVRHNQSLTQPPEEQKAKEQHPGIPTPNRPGSVFWRSRR